MTGQPALQRRARATLAAGAVAVLACTGCAHLPPSPAAAAAARVPLPLAAPGVVDARQAFSTLFEKALRLDDPMPQGGPWLHDVQPEQAAQSHGAIDGRALGQEPATPAASTAVLIVPGLFGDCVQAQAVPFGDGRMRTSERSVVESYAQYADLGLHSIRMVSLPGRVSSAENGRRLAAAIRSEASNPSIERIILLAFSKGLPDTLQALATLQAAEGIPAKVSALVSVAGVVKGTPIAEHYERLYAWLAPRMALGDCAASDGHELESLTYRQQANWLDAHPLSPQLRYYSIVAHAPAEETAIALRPFHALLSEWDERNDGQVLAVDAVLPGSTLLAEARADHWDVALPRDRHPSAAMRALTSGRKFPREALFRATLWWLLDYGRLQNR